MHPVAPLNARVPEWTFAERLRKVRRETLRINQEEMAERLNVKRSTYEAWETGRNRPDVALLSEQLEQITGITRLWFIGWADNAPQPGPGTPTGVTKAYLKSQKMGTRENDYRSNVAPIAHRRAIAA